MIKLGHLPSNITRVEYIYPKYSVIYISPWNYLKTLFKYKAQEKNPVN
jgi:hypothetical protein